jgi:uncharacterized protein YndB with AHSA1/START domain
VRFQIEQRFDAGPDEVMRAFTDPALYDRMVGMARVERPVVIDAVRDGDIVVTRVRFRFIADLPSAARAVVDPAKLTWIDETRYDLVAHTSATRLLPDHYPDRLRATASSRFDPDPADAARTVRRVQGELTVRAPLVAGKVERAIVEGLQEHLVDEARVVAEHLAG